MLQHTDCKSGHELHVSFQRNFNHYKDHPPKHGLTSNAVYPDNFNACIESEIVRSIETINETINPTTTFIILAIAPSDFNLDPSKIDVKKVDTRNNRIIQLQENSANGFKYIGKKDNQNIMLSPSEEVLSNKHFIELWRCWVLTQIISL